MIFAKTTTPEFCYFGITDSPVNGRTSNPWDVDRTPGGSSGGAGAAVAAGFGPLALGGDGGGSIRIPAAFCGLVGFKPTFGLVPREPCAVGWKTLVAYGPLARSVSDARLMLQALAGWHPRDRHSLDVDGLDTPAADPRTLRVVASEDLGFAPLDDDVRRAFRAVVARLEAAGAQVVEDTTGLDSSVATWSTIATAEARHSEAAQFEHHHALLGAAAAEFMAHGGLVTREHYVSAQMAREPIHRAYVDLFERSGASVLLTPTLGVEAFPHGSAYPEQIGGVPIEPPWLDWCGLLYDANLAGLPACAVPIGLGDDGLPVSVQVLGPRGSDGAVLAAAEAIERLVDFSARPPEPQTLEQRLMLKSPVAHAPTDPTLRGIPEIRQFFRTNETPIYFISPTAFNLLGIDRWVRNLFYVTFFDSFEGAHPRVVVPTDRTHREFLSIEDVCNHLLRDPEILAWMAARGPGGKAAFVMFDAETEALAAKAGLEVIHPPAAVARAAGLQARDHPDRGRGRVAERAEHDRPGHVLRRADDARRRGVAGRRSRGPDRVRRLRQDDVLPQGPARLGPARRQARRRRAEDHEAHQQLRGLPRSLADQQRDRRRAVHDQPHRLPRADPVQGRLVRQRHLPRRAAPGPPRAGPGPHREARRPARPGGLPRLLRGRLPRRPRHGRALSGRAQPAAQRDQLDDQRDRRRLRRHAAVPLPPARVHGRPVRDRRRRHQPPLGA